ncbi:ATP phosphoribosyltransferase regulatory subunit [Roseicyclus marinus]|uniref:ATP phosphoribosyltransferase regulatory subunit n=2 Tax=Roseicyclus marinus TaxID=2161673 RepID=A0AA48HB37_9RHOB|nr:ATP phosphoribosyltransferase regulatory subunit [Roseicyclus marinus]
MTDTGTMHTAKTDTAKTDKASIRAEAARFLAAFEAAGAFPVETDLLQPAGTLLDLYGEDIRARAYVTHDPDRGEMMLRPDFTVPVVQRHMANGADPARYAYLGEVFRTQPAGSRRPSEYLQVGYEVFDRADPVGADAEVFALFSRLLAPHGLRAVTGDIGLLLAAIDTLTTTAPRKAALRRHIWRPRRFRALIDRFTNRTAPSPARASLIAAAKGQGAQSLIAEAGPEIGLRSATEIAARIDTLIADAAAPPIPAPEAEVLATILSLKANLPEACEHLRDLCVDMPGLGPAVDRFAARIDALAHAGVAVETTPFEASYGRTTMEYYDGFVFGFLVPARPDLPPAATGGRYDALTRILGAGREIPAVGGVIRPGVLAQAGAEGRP